jgi:RES domain-containing protein
VPDLAGQEFVPDSGNALRRDWRNEPPPHATQTISLEWDRRNEIALLRMPSVIVPREVNYLLNPRHPAFAKLKIPPPVLFDFDSRMWK